MSSSDPLSLLCPRPKHIHKRNGQFVLGRTMAIAVTAPIAPIWSSAQRLAGQLTALGQDYSLRAAPAQSQTDHPYRTSEPTHAATIVLQCLPSLQSQPQGYKLHIQSNTIRLQAGTPQGLFYGVSTLRQLLQLFAPKHPHESFAIPCLLIEDRPSFPQRGVMLDVSRDKVPTMKTLYAWIDRFADWKFNQVQLYTEHTFAYQGHEKVWTHASPLTGEEILQLDAYCRERFIELVPNQNSFGHMHRWLVHEPYNQLAEAPEGIEHAFSLKKEPFSLCPLDPGSTQLLADLYSQLLPHFTSRQFNVGLDETFDLGQGRSAEACEAQGKERVYLQFLQQVHQLASHHGRQIQFWGDIVLKHPALIPELPTDAIALVWGYEADHPFEEQTKAFAEAGLHFYVCPGTSSWNTIAGRTDNALRNLQNAAINGHKHHALGYLITDWGDNGHLQPLPVSDIGFLAGAAMSWNSESAENLDDFDFPALLNQHVYQDPSGHLGQAVWELGQLYQHTQSYTFNSSPLFALLFLPRMADPHTMEGLTHQSLEATKAAISSVRQHLEQSQSQRRDHHTLQRELHWATDMMELSCELTIARLNAAPNTPLSALPESKPLATRLLFLQQRYDNVWLSRNRMGGLNESKARLDQLHKRMTVSESLLEGVE